MKLDLQNPQAREKLKQFMRSGKINELSEYELRQLYIDIEAFEKAQKVAAAQNNLIPYCMWMNPEYKPGKIHYMLAEKLEAMECGDINRLAVAMAPRMGKSWLCSRYFVSWYLGRHPSHHIMGASNNSELAEIFGRDVRNDIGTPAYTSLFDTRISKDSASASRWATTAGGNAFYAGVGTSLAGRGAHLFVLDDVFSEQDLQSGTETPFNKVYDWYLAGPRQRLMANGKILIIHTRWTKTDLIGRVLKDAQTNSKGDQFEYMELPAILPSGESLWPEMWSKEELLKTKATMSTNGKKYLWDAQYQQQPTGRAATFVVEQDFNRWEKREPPPCDYIIMTLDAAVEKTNRSDYSVFQVWGIFTHDSIAHPETHELIPQIILLDMVRERLEFPELKARAKQLVKDYDPDAFDIEKRASGSPLLHELRRSGIPCGAFEPGTPDKIARFNSVLDMIKSKMIWIPQGFLWASQFLEEVCGFPNEAHDDCLVGETLITMADGARKRLDTVEIGDFVRTPEGPKRVLVNGCTGLKTVYEVSIGDATLVMTDNHPIATMEGWKTVHELTMMDSVIASIYRRSSWEKHAQVNWLFEQMRKWWSLTGAVTVDILIRTMGRIGVILVGRVVSCIGICGNFITALFPKVGMCTTGMATQRTTGLKIWNVFRRYSITPSTASNVLSREPVRDNSRTWPQYATKPSSGMPHRKVGNGIGSTLKKLCDELMQRNDTHLHLIGKSFVLSAELCSRLSLHAPNFAATAVSVGSISVAKQRRHTYNLMVEDCHCYFANDILVHNCVDALTMALLRIRRGNFIRLPTDPEDEDVSNTWYQKPKFYGCR